MKPIDQLTDAELTQQLRRAVHALPDAPPAWLQAASALWPVQPTLLGQAVQAAQALLRQVAAVLTFDSRATPGLALGMRSGPSTTRHLLYSAAGRDIDLRITPAHATLAQAAGQTFALTGQILGPDESGVVELAAGAGSAVAPLQVQLDALGEFRFDGLAPGGYGLTLRLGADEIVLPPLEVGA